MNTKNKARPGEATPEQAKGLGSSTGTGTTSRTYDSTWRQRGQDVIAAMVDHERGMKASEIQERFGYSPRETRRLVNYERVVKGQLICANKHGYFYGSDREIEANIRTLRKTAASDLEVADAMERSLRQRQGQTILEGWS